MGGKMITGKEILEGLKTGKEYLHIQRNKKGDCIYKTTVKVVYGNVHFISQCTSWSEDRARLGKLEDLTPQQLECYIRNCEGDEWTSYPA